MQPIIRSCAVALILALPAPALDAQMTHAIDVNTYDPSKFAGMRYRMIGPARGGRVTAVTGVPQEPMTFYFGST